jgi:hypothetical protein
MQKQKSPEEKQQKKNPHAVALGRRGGKKGGKALAAKRTPEERSEAMRKAVNARWARWREERARSKDQVATEPKERRRR